MVAASPFEPAGGVAGRFRAGKGGEQAPDLVDGERDEAGSAAADRLAGPAAAPGYRSGPRSGQR